MSQLTVYRNKNSRTNKEIPFLVDVQSDLLSELKTRLVIPLVPLSNLKPRPLAKLAPEMAIEGTALILMTPLLAGVSVKELGEPVENLLDQRPKILAAIDFLISGF